MGALPGYAFLIKNTDKNGQDSYSGLLWDLIEFIQKARNCTITVVSPPDGLWAFCYGHNNCTDMIGMVNRSEVDFSLGMAHPATKLYLQGPYHASKDLTY